MEARGEAAAGDGYVAACRPSVGMVLRRVERSR
jgi:hypothetical protein